MKRKYEIFILKAKITYCKVAYAFWNRVGNLVDKAMKLVDRGNKYE